MTPEEAYDEMCGVFNAHWPHAVVWSDKAGAPPANQRPWARVSVRHAEGGQSALASGVRGRLYTNTGTIWIEIFTAIGDGRANGDTLVHGVLQAYRDARGSVWYRRHRFREGGREGAYQRSLALIDFTYDT